VDNASAVSEEYKPPFPFKGRIEQVTIELKEGDPVPSSRAGPAADAEEIVGAYNGVTLEVLR
jgi:hypothetical protein